MSRQGAQRHRRRQDSQTTGTLGSPARQSRGLLVIAALALIVLTTVVYTDVWSFDYVGVDDPAYASRNANVSGGLTASGVQWALTTGEAANWHPMTWLSLMLDVSLFGDGARPHHTVNLLLHIANALLLFCLLAKSTGAFAPSAFVAALFAVHPMHVESVAWVSERKDVLSTLFWLLTMAAYTSWTRRPRTSRYLVMLTLFGLGLMAKPMLVTLPIVLLLWDAWPLQRLDGARTLWPRVREKLPMLALVVASSAATVLAQHRGGAVTSLDVVPLALRAQNAIVSYGRYIAKLFWPTGLTMYYPMPESWPLGLVLAVAAGLVAVTALALWLFRARPFLASGWLWYVVSLIPVIGLIQVGRQSMADRYTYVPAIGLFIMVAWGVAALARGRLTRTALTLVALAVVATSAVAARTQVSYWRDDLSLWTHALQVRLNLDDSRARLAAQDLLADNTMQAFVTFLERRLPDGSKGFDAADARHFLGLVFARHGQTPEAIVSLSEAVSLNPSSAGFHRDLGHTLADTGRHDDAIAEYQAALKAQPVFADAQNDWGVVLMAQNKAAEAIPHFIEAVRMQPDLVDAHRNLALALVKSERYPEAAKAFAEVLRLVPGDEQARRALDALQKRRGG